MNTREMYALLLHHLDFVGYKTKNSRELIVFVRKVGDTLAHKGDEVWPSWDFYDDIVDDLKLPTTDREFDLMDAGERNRLTHMYDEAISKANKLLA